MESTAGSFVPLESELLQAAYQLDGDSKISLLVKNRASKRWAVVSGIPIGRDGILNCPYFSFINDYYRGYSDRPVPWSAEVVAPGGKLQIDVDLAKNYPNLDVQTIALPERPAKVEFSLFQTESDAELFKSQYMKGSIGEFELYCLAPWIAKWQSPQ